MLKQSAWTFMKTKNTAEDKLTQLQKMNFYETPVECNTEILCHVC
jgi:hypothetical protein